MAGRRESNKQRVREAIVDAAQALFTEHGFENVSVDSIVDRANVSARTFFRYFPTKEHVAFPHWEERSALFGKALAAEGAGLEGARRAMQAVAAEIEASAASRQQELMQQSIVDRSATLRAREAELFSDWESMIAKHLRDSSAKKASRQATVVAAALMGAMRATFRLWVRGEGKPSLKRLGDEAYEALVVAFQASQEPTDERAHRLP